MSRPVQDVKVFGVQNRQASDRVKQPWIARWSVEGRQHSRSFRTKTEAERFRGLLVHARTTGEPFDTSRGEPLSWCPAPDEIKVHVWAKRWLEEQWTEWQPRTRVSALEALARFVPLVVPAEAPPAPMMLRRHLYEALPPGSDGLPDPSCDSWLERWCPTIGRLDRDLLAMVEAKLMRTDDGRPLSASTASRYRKVARACIRRAVELEILDADPWPPSPLGRARRKAMRTKRRVDVRRLPDPETMARAIAAIPTHQPGSHKYELMTAVVYYGGLRPSEVAMLRPRALELSEQGWGRIDVVEADISYDEPGDPKTGPRSVPIPPVLVEMLRNWVRKHDLKPDELLFRTRTGRLPQRSNWSRAWQRALRETGLSSLRVYDCRHAAATTWLKAGAPLGEVARRMGHSVETLVSTYVGALSGDEAITNARIEEVLTMDLKS